VNNTEGITMHDFNLYYRAITIKTVWYWHKNRYEELWSRTEDSGMNPCNYAHLILDKDATGVQWRKDRLFNKCCWKNLIPACRKLKLDSCLSPCTSINSKVDQGL
jgi:hypothetical protein